MHDKNGARPTFNLALMIARGITMRPCVDKNRAVLFAGRGVALSFAPRPMAWSPGLNVPV